MHTNTGGAALSCRTGKAHRTSRHCWVPVTREDGARARFMLNRVQRIEARATRNGAGIELVVRFPEDAWAVGVAEALDAFALRAAIDYNGDWFKNGLSEEQILEFFRTSVERRHGGAVEMRVTVSATSTPHTLEVAGRAYDNFDDWYKEWRRHAKSARDVRLEVEVAGLLFGATEFGLRYHLRSAVVETVAPGEEVAFDRLELEGELRADLTRALASQHARLTDRLRACNEAQARGAAELEALEALPAVDAAWHARFDALDKMLGCWTTE